MSTLKTWMHPNLDLDSSRYEYFAHVIFFPQDHNDLQCSMNYGPAHESHSNVYTLEEDFFQCIVMCPTLGIHESGKIGHGPNYGICER